MSKIVVQNELPGAGSTLFRNEVKPGGIRTEGGPAINFLKAKHGASVSIFACALIVLIITLIYLGAYTRRVTVIGVLTPPNGIVRIISSVSGVIVAKNITEAERVIKGQPLFVIADDRRAADEGNDFRLSEKFLVALNSRRESLVKSIQGVNEIETDQRLSLLARSGIVKKEISEIQRDISLTKSRIEASSEILEAHRQMLEEGHLAKVLYVEKEDSVKALKMQLSMIGRQRDELSNNLHALQSEIAQLNSKSNAQREDLKRSLSVLDQEVAEIKVKAQFTISAPIDGIATTVNAQIGQQISGQSLAIVIPHNSKLEVKLFAPSRAVGFIRQGQVVRLRFQAFPYQKYGQYFGRVVSVARSPTAATEVAATYPIDLVKQENVYQITAALERPAQNWQLSEINFLPGMVVEADIEQETRRIWEWLLEPIMGLSKIV